MLTSLEMEVFSLPCYVILLKLYLVRVALSLLWYDVFEQGLKVLSDSNIIAIEEVFNLSGFIFLKVKVSLYRPARIDNETGETVIWERAKEIEMIVTGRSKSDFYLCKV